MRSPVTNRIGNNPNILFPIISQFDHPSIIKGCFDYNETFEAFLKGTSQKKETALVVGFYAKKLQEAQILLNGQKPVEIADIGCSDSVTCLEYLKKMNYAPGFNYYGIDTNQQFLQEAKAKLVNEEIIKKYILINDNALSGGLAQREEFSSIPFEFIFVSHTAYYIKDQLSGRIFLEDINKLLSKKSGVAVFLHEDSTHYFRSTYNPNQFNTISTPVLLEKSAQELNANSTPLTSISFASKLHFPPLDKELWENLKNPSNYTMFANQLDFVDTLKKLAFIVQCDLTALAEAGTLSTYIDEVKNILSNNDNCLNLETHMQAFVAPQCVNHEKIAIILREIEKEIPALLENERKKEIGEVEVQPYSSSFICN